jgi:hypothetical protein
MAGVRRDEASRTAVLVCQGRAVAHERLAVGRFEDPTAMALLRGAERAAVERARADGAPNGWADRMDVEMLHANAEVMVPRTVAIDDAVRQRPNPQLVILGAGLDGRAWRMPELADVDVFEVDPRDRGAATVRQDPQPAISQLRPRSRRRGTRTPNLLIRRKTANGPDANQRNPGAGDERDAPRGRWPRIEVTGRSTARSRAGARRACGR